MDLKPVAHLPQLISALLLEKVLKYLSAGHTKGVPGPFLLIAE